MYESITVRKPGEPSLAGATGPESELWSLERVLALGLPPMDGAIVEIARGDESPLTSTRPELTAFLEAELRRCGVPSDGVIRVDWRISGPSGGRGGCSIATHPARDDEVGAWLRFCGSVISVSTALYGRSAGEVSDTTRLVLNERRCTRMRDLDRDGLIALASALTQRISAAVAVPYPGTVCDQFAFVVETLAETVSGAAPETEPLPLVSVQVQHAAVDSSQNELLWVVCEEEPRFGRSRDGSGELVDLPDHWTRDLLEPLAQAARQHLGRGRTWRLRVASTTNGLRVREVSELPETALSRIKAATLSLKDENDTRSREAINPLSASDIQSTLRRRFVETRAERARPAAVGLAAAPGAVSGRVATEASRASWWDEGAPTIFFATSPTPSNVSHVLRAAGSVFGTGGLTSHIAVIARGSGLPCITGMAGLSVKSDGSIQLGDSSVHAGDWVSIDGTTGEVFLGRRETVRGSDAEIQALEQLLAACDAISSVTVLANADTADEALHALKNGARGIGLCRLEHVMSRPGMLELFQQCLVYALAFRHESCAAWEAVQSRRQWGNARGADASVEHAQRILGSVSGYHRYIEILTQLEALLRDHLFDLICAAGARKLVVRLADPPLAEFLQEYSTNSLEVMGIDLAHADAFDQVASARESALGLRGVRLCLAAPELASMQIRSVLGALAKCDEEVTLELLVPFVSDPGEMTSIKDLVESASLAWHASGSPDRPLRSLRVGSMIETPRAALAAGKIAGVADFVSFGTSDLTQFICAASRDGAASTFSGLPPYQRMSFQPFENFDAEGLGALIALAVERIRSLYVNYEIGVCGSFSSDANAMSLFARLGISYVSCAADDVPHARLLAAKASLG